ncbi:MAG: hypothetical protein AMS24_02625 [Chlamydiae bacterium SM23_39]|nr:MAG: hypothetical protein AMS24_02625 [Chlamydiae bacterium SM23_39]
MKIAIPTEGEGGITDAVAKHFGRCKTYTILDEDGNLVKIIKNITVHFGGEKLPPELIKDFGVSILLCQDIGLKALKLCQKLKIKVFIGDETNVLEIFKKWKKGCLMVADMTNICKSGH